MAKDPVADPPISSFLEAFDELGKAEVDPATGLAKKGKKRGRWKPPPVSARWSDLYSTCSGSVLSSLEACQELIGTVERGERLHLISHGNWAMEQPICHLGDQLGPCDLFMATWAVNDCDECDAMWTDPAKACEHAALEAEESESGES